MFWSGSQPDRSKLSYLFLVSRQVALQKVVQKAKVFVNALLSQRRNDGLARDSAIVFAAVEWKQVWWDKTGGKKKRPRDTKKCSHFALSSPPKP